MLAVHDPGDWFSEPRWLDKLAATGGVMMIGLGTAMAVAE